ncbi:restriction endonuclease subunit S [Anaerovibrio lipolyticus]|uniref:restriction endonuclease subunit S n=1 Tax=Anaerovibrio lipolyticus TaxID=82374 RepID=UPI0023F2CDF5|nr:restriction endonuclease subunit S [Anaerovibrio lipolyticus]
MNTPNIRFKGFTDNWEKRKLGDVSEYNNGLGHEEYVQSEGKYELITLKSINTEGYLVPSGKYLIEEFETLKKDTLIMMLSEQAKGMLGMTTIIPCNNKYVLNQRVASLVPKDGINASFLTRAINIRQTYFEQMGAGTKVQNISKGNVENCDLLIPSVDEQSKIGHYFDNLDNLITLHQRKCDDLKEVKKYMLQKMFPKKGEKVPEIRFKGFTGDWEVRKFGDVFKEYSEKKHEELPPLTIIQGGGTILREESDRNLQYDKANLSNYKMVKKDDFIVHLRSFEGGLEKANSDGIISPAYHTFHGDNTDSRFYYPFFRSRLFINTLLKPHVYGIRDGKSIDIDGMKTIKIPVPSYEEQQKIGAYIESMDNQITLYQKKLDTLKEVKKFMLQNMFPQ